MSGQHRRGGVSRGCQATHAAPTLLHACVAPQARTAPRSSRGGPQVLYAQDGPPEPVAIMLFRGVLQAAALVACYSAFAGGAAKGAGSQQQQQQQQQPQPQQAAEAAGSGSSSGSSDGSGGGGLVPGWAAKVPLTAIAAAELGTWLFLATGIQTVGLQLTTATRAGFLIQSTVLLTPVLAWFSGQRPSRNVWAGCIVALAGCLLIATDASAADPAAGAAFSLGACAARGRAGLERGSGRSAHACRHV